MGHLLQLLLGRPQPAWEASPSTSQLAPCCCTRGGQQESVERLGPGHQAAEPAGVSGAQLQPGLGADIWKVNQKMENSVFLLLSFFTSLSPSPSVSLSFLLLFK